MVSCHSTCAPTTTRASRTSSWLRPPSASGRRPRAEGAEVLLEQLALVDRGLQEGADPQHVIYEVVLKLGYSINATIEPLDVEGNRVYRVVDEVEGTHQAAASFFVCLDDELQDETIDALPLDKETTCVCLDTALDDSQKVNLAMGCLLKVI